MIYKKCILIIPSSENQRVRFGLSETCQIQCDGYHGTRFVVDIRQPVQFIESSTKRTCICVYVYMYIHREREREVAYNS